MNVEIKNKKENILMSRIEVEAKLTFDKSATPSTDEVKKALSKELGVEKDLIVIKKIATAFGNSSAVVRARQYLSKDDIKNIEPRNKKAEEKEKAEAEKKAKEAADKKAQEATAKEAEKKAEPKAEEKKAEKEEEKKEEPKAEEKKE